MYLIPLHVYVLGKSGEVSGLHLGELNFPAWYVSLDREGFSDIELSYVINFSSIFFTNKYVAGIMLTNSVI